MLKTKSKILLALSLIILLVSSYCFATVEPRTTDENDTAAISEDSEVTEDTNEDNEYSEEPDLNIIYNDLYIVEDTVNMSDLVSGNVFIVGNDVTISGQVDGNVFVIANKLTIDNAYIYNTLFACATEITFNGVYINDVYATSNIFNLESTAIIYRDMHIASSNVTISGMVGRDAYIASDNISFNTNSESNIYGNLHYNAPSEIEIPESAVAGETTYNSSNGEVASISDTILAYVTDLLQTLFFTFIIAIVLLLLTPKFIDRVGNISVKKSFASLGIGILAPVVFIIVGILLALTSIGSSVAIFGIFAVIALFCIAFSITSIFFGKLLAKLFKLEGIGKYILLTLASSLVLWAICKIPVVGGFLSIIITLFGVGLTLVNMFWKKEKVEKTEVTE